MMTRRQGHQRLALILSLFFLVGLAHSFLVPLQKAPDEVAHFLYSRFIARHHRLPIDQGEREEAGYLSFWPPLYHGVVAVFAGWADTKSPPYPKFVWESPRFELARELLDTKRLANTEDEFMPYQGQIRMWHWGRIVSIGLSMGTIIITFFTTLELCPKNYRLAVTASGLIAFVPTFVFISSVMSYEPLVALTTGLYFWILVRIIKGRATMWHCLGLGLCIGLSVVTKYAGVLLPLQVAVVFAYLAWKQGWGWSGWLSKISLTAFTSIIASGWWFAFLIINFNEIEQWGLVVGSLKPIIAGGIDASQNYVAAVLTDGAIGTTESLEITSDPLSAWVMQMFQSFWSMEIGHFVLWPLGHALIGVTLIISMGSLIRMWLHHPAQRIWIALLISQLVLFLVFPLLRFFIQGQVSWTAQGRHILFPIATTLPLFIVYGGLRQLSGRTQRYAGLALMGGVTAWSLAQLVQVITFYTPPLPIRTTAEVVAQIPHPLEVTFGQHLQLLGYESQVLPEEARLDLDFYWQSPTYADEDYLLDVSLLQNGQPHLQWSAYPINGRYPTRIWESWETIRDDLSFPLLDLQPGEYQIELQLRGGDGPLPVDGNEQALRVTEVTIPASTVPDVEIDLPLHVEGRIVVSGLSLWQAEAYRELDLPKYRPRMAIPFVWQGEPSPTERVEWLLVSPEGQLYPSRQASPHFEYVIVGLDWPSGDYRLRAEIWQDDVVVGSQETAPLVTIFNERPRQVQPPPLTHALNVNFANRVKLLGYDLPQQTLEPGQAIPVTLYWQGLRTMGQSYTIFTKLFDDQEQLWGSAERLPADGYSTIYWLEDEVVTDSFALPVTRSDLPHGLYWLNVGLYQEIAGEAVSLPITDDDPNELTSVTFGPLKIGGPPPGVVLAPQEIAPHVSLDVAYGTPPVILLRGYDLVETEEALQVTLYWESLAPTPTNWSTFIHVRDEAGEILAQKDGPTGSGRYPTSVWATGEVVADEYIIPNTNLSGTDYELFVGLYDLVTGDRLAVTNAAATETLLIKDVR